MGATELVSSPMASENSSEVHEIYEHIKELFEVDFVPVFFLTLLQFVFWVIRQTKSKSTRCCYVLAIR